MAPKLKRLSPMEWCYEPLSQEKSRHIFTNGTHVFMNYAFTTSQCNNIVLSMSRGNKTHVYLSRPTPGVYDGSFRWFLIDACIATCNPVYVHIPKTNLGLIATVRDIIDNINRDVYVRSRIRGEIACKLITEAYNTHSIYRGTLHGEKQGPDDHPFRFVVGRIEWLREHKWITEYNKRVNVTYDLKHHIGWYYDMILYFTSASMKENGVPVTLDVGDAFVVTEKGQSYLL